MRAMEPIESERPKTQVGQSLDSRPRTDSSAPLLHRPPSRSGRHLVFSEKHFQIDPTWNLSGRTRVRYRWIETFLTPGLLSRNIEEVTRIITPICNTDPAIKVSDARVGLASARE